MTTQKLLTACSMLASVMFAANGCGQPAPAPQPVAQTDHASDDQDHGPKAHDHSGWWCAEHGIPEAECSLCNSKVAAAFKAKGDWCDEHDRAKSQCFLCDPKLKEKFAALYRAKEGKEPPPFEEDTPAADDKKKGT